MQSARILSVKSSIQRVGLLLITLFCSLIGVSAQTVKGKVFDAEKKEPVVGALVKINYNQYSTITDGDGEFKFENLPKGTYRISVSYIGFQGQDQEVTLDGGKKAKLDFKLLTSSKTLSEVIVKDKSNHETEAGARLIERDATNILNIISAKEIEHSPDINAANIVQRIPAVSLTRGDANQEYVVIRGLEQRYNNTLINGIKIPSPDDKNRSVPINIIPSELIGDIEISKTLTADMELDAIGGTVNINFKDAPSKRILEFNLAGGYNQTLFSKPFQTFHKSYFLNLDPSERFPKSTSLTLTDFSNKTLAPVKSSIAPNSVFGFSYGERFLKKKLGLIVTASNQNIYNITASKYFNGNFNFDNTFNVANSIDRRFTDHVNQFGINTKLDYKFSERNKISFSAIYLNTDRVGFRSDHDTLIIGNGRNGPFDYGHGRVTVDQRALFQAQNLYNFNLQGDHTLLPCLKATWDASFSRSDSKIPDQTDLLTDFTILPGGALQDGGIIIGVPAIQHTWQKNYDQDQSGNVKFSGDILKQGKVSISYKAGALYRHKSRNNYNNYYLIYPSSSYVYTGYDPTRLSVYSLLAGSGAFDPNNYHAEEKISAGYAMAIVKVKQWDLTAGVRDEFTNQFNRFKTQPQGQILYRYFKYSDLGPSIHLTYSFSQFSKLRASYNAAISRPNYYELVPYDEYTGNYYSRGNPNLLHTRSYNYDLQYEYYSKPEDAYTIGVFYKKLTNPIELKYIASSAGSTILEYANSTKAVVYGFELDAIHYFNRFGISTNYTFTNSIVNDEEQFYVSTPNPDGSTTHAFHPLRVTRPLQSQSKNLFNASLIYKDDKSRLRVQASVLYQGKRIDQTQPEVGFNINELAYTVLALSAEKGFGKTFTVFLKANNLNNPAYELRLANGALIQKDTYGQDYLLGLKIKLY